MFEARNKTNGSVRKEFVMESKSNIEVLQSSECYYCGKKQRCPYVGDRDDCQITKITDAKWIVGRASFRDSLNNLKRFNEAACNPNISAAIAELNVVWDLSNLPVLEDTKG